MVQLFDFAVMTIFAREFLEGAIIVVEYRAIIRYGGPQALRPGLTQARALREVTLSTLFAAALALLVVAAIAIPLAVLSMSFDDSASELVEGFSKLVAAVSLMFLSLKLPKFLGVGPYGASRQPTTKEELEAQERDVQVRRSQKRFRLFGRRERTNAAAVPMGVQPPPLQSTEGGTEGERDAVTSSRILALPGSDATTTDPLSVPDGGGDAAPSGEEVGDMPAAISNNNNYGLTVRAIRFNVAWNLWREVAECGVFLIPFFLTGDGVAAIPLSAVSGAVVGIAVAAAIAVANMRCTNRSGLAVLVATLIAFLSGGLFTDAIHIFEERWGETPTVWTLPGEGWSQYRLPLTLLKPFGYSASRTVLQLAGFWLWMGGIALLHWFSLRRARNRRDAAVAAAADPKTDVDRLRRLSSSASSGDADTAEAGESSLEEGGILPLKKEPDNGDGNEAIQDGLSQCCSTAVETEESSSTLSPSPPSGVPDVVEAPLRRGAEEADDDMDECSTLDRVVGGLCGSGRPEPSLRGSGDEPPPSDAADADADEEGTV